MSSPFGQMLRCLGLGHPPIAWFYPVAPLPWKVRVLGELLHYYGRQVGVPFPRPVWLDLRESERMACWLATRLRAGRRVAFTQYASSGVRVAEAAARLGLSLEGVCFLCIGEPFTRAKLAAIEAVGGVAAPSYSTTETGAMGIRCAA